MNNIKEHVLQNICDIESIMDYVSEYPHTFLLLVEELISSVEKLIDGYDEVLSDNEKLSDIIDEISGTIYLLEHNGCNLDD